ncbi:hypothetical protein [Cupriavidus campinensis]|uniref:Uncharacterized protein n=1 Tax=Cupriavidus campinensis TaxID=151783 RepID=A0AAE9HXW7_9BURK|nr:hypothetical protein [Cupriavidus campinensis]URF02776.1 hypothetical protein M5D45_09335 [Cupriavidus campinensis]
MARIREWIAQHRATFGRIAHMLEAVTLMALMMGGGVGAGYALCQWQARDQLAQQRGDHQAEIARLQAAYSQTLAVLTPKVAEAANASALAAEASVEAAKSVKRATRPAAPAAARPLSEAERQDVNRDIEAANRKVREARK